ncbi:MAG: Rrf2 family iron-sulfur cluster assembly transcriptional regulator [Myxococcota bacterium]|jgi:Rrf2 family iron-sulfur cluster assembly transcriptional regulator
MLLNQTAEYALRAMSSLAIHHEEGRIRSKVLAERTNIPLFYLSKVMRRLVLAGLVTSKRGHGGGFQLAKPPGQIRFIDILEAMDYQAELGRCAFGIGRCDAESPCPLHDSWSALQNEFFAWARSNRLDHLSGDRFGVTTSE